MGLEGSGIPGVFIVWPDILYEGPTPLATGEKWIAARTGYLADVALRKVDQVAARYRQNDAALEAFRGYEEVVFWLEHDLFDQLLLIRHLWWMGVRGVSIRRVQSGKRNATRFSLVCRDTYLGPLTPDRFPPLFAARQPVTDAQIALGSRVWRAFCGEDPSRLLVFTIGVAQDLPFLAAALHRYLEEFPSAATGLSRTETQILRVVSGGPLPVGEAFQASTALEDAIFLGDLSFFNIVHTLASARHPMLAIGESSPEPPSFAERTIRLTDTGREVLAGRADHIALNGIDRWMGGVHLKGTDTWRWDGSQLHRAVV